MRIRRIAVLIDGGFFLKRLPGIVGHDRCKTAADVADWANHLCKAHVETLVDPWGKYQINWLDHIYRLFYYDATPYDGTAHHPITNKVIQYAKSPEALFRHELFNELRSRPKFALRLGKVVKEDGWHLRSPGLTKKLLRTRDCVNIAEELINRLTAGEKDFSVPAEQLRLLRSVTDSWNQVSADDIRLGLRQKGVDMRLGVDISTLTLKKQVDTIILVTGDSDFVPAAKVARREGVEVILNPLGRNVKEDLNEHVDGITSVRLI